MHRYNIDILNLFNPELQLINPKPMIRNKLKELLSELKNLKFRQYLSLSISKEMIVKSSIRVLN